jgi:hypothetical protein
MEQSDLFYLKIEKKYTKICIYERTFFLEQNIENSSEKREEFCCFEIEKLKIQQIKIQYYKIINELFWRKLRIYKIGTYKTKWQKCSIKLKELKTKNKNKTEELI